MSCVTVKVPKAPEPLACMRRSGMISRLRLASFSISQTSCISSGPRGPAVEAVLVVDHGRAEGGGQGCLVLGIGWVAHGASSRRGLKAGPLYEHPMTFPNDLRGGTGDTME